MQRIVDHSCATTDTLVLRLSATRHLQMGFTRIAVEVDMAGSETAPEDPRRLAARVRDRLRGFVNASWTLVAVRHDIDATGRPRTRLQAQANLFLRDAADLDLRAERIRSPGFAITRVSVGRGHSVAAMQEPSIRLEAELLALIDAQASRLSTLSGRRWRIGDVSFSHRVFISDPPRELRRPWRVEILARYGQRPRSGVSLCVVATAILKSTAPDLAPPRAHSALSMPDRYLPAPAG